MSFPPEALKSLAEKIAALLIERKCTLSVVETACGGIISSTLLSIPRSSRFYRGGLTLYTLESRVAYGGWKQEDIDTYQGPTKEIVTGLARHVRQTLGATYCVAESGTAGPTGGKTINRNPGECAIGVASADGDNALEFATGSAVRADNQILFAKKVLEVLLDELENDSIRSQQRQQKI